MNDRTHFLVVAMQNVWAEQLSFDQTDTCGPLNPPLRQLCLLKLTLSKYFPENVKSIWGTLVQYPLSKQNTKTIQ